MKILPPASFAILSVMFLLRLTACTNSSVSCCNSANTRTLHRNESTSLINKVCVRSPFLRLFCAFEGSFCLELFNQSGVCGDLLLCWTGKADGTGDAPVFLRLGHLGRWMLKASDDGILQGGVPKKFPPLANLNDDFTNGRGRASGIEIAVGQATGHD